MIKPNPGTKEAQDLGCICPVMDNHYGYGVPDGKGGVNFWYVGGCPVHSGPTPSGEKEVKGEDQVWSR